jgi:tripartite-type tricarboxylate transporter receptor subunit TctC
MAALTGPRHFILHPSAFLLCAAALLAAMPAGAADFPSRPIRIVVPYTPGGITDVSTRIVAQELAKSLQQNVLVDNRPGANSILGVEIVSKSTPDGYTLASVIAAHAANQTLYSKLPYDPIKSFATVSLIASAPLIMCATNALPAASVKEFIAYARANPGKLSFASSGVGAAAHLTTEYLMITTGIKMIHVPYKGTAPALQDLLGGQVQIMFDVPSSMMPHVRAGKIKALAMASEKRFFAAPEVPTLVESGVAVVAGTWVGFLAPAGTPQAVVDKLGITIGAIFKRAEVRERFVQLGIEPVGSSSQEFAQFLRDEVAKWAKVIRAANVRMDN